MTPFRKSLTPYTDSYNFFQSFQRVHVEQALGMLVAKWRILKSPLMFSPRKNSQTLICATKLHNFSIAFSDSPEKEDVPGHIMNSAVGQLNK